MDYLTALLRLAALVLGLALVSLAVVSALRTFVLPRSSRDPITRRVFLSLRALLELRLRRTKDYLVRDRVMALYAPAGLLLLPLAWLTLVGLGFFAIYWALGISGTQDAFLLSLSSLLTLGFFPPPGVGAAVLATIEAAVGLILIALLIAYLPTMYTAFSRRERAVTLLEVRAGSPPSAIEMLERYHRLGRLDRLREVWVEWEQWFAEIEESHTSLAMLVFFRSPNPSRSWVTAAGAVLDAASLTASTLDLPRDAQVDLCLRAGYLALREVAAFFRLPFDSSPRPDDPILVTRDEFDAACRRLAASGLTLKDDRDQAWRDFAGWRVNYDSVLLDLARLTMAPPGVLWSTDRPRVRPPAASDVPRHEVER
jgi:fumarate reductase subunit D